MPFIHIFGLVGPGIDYPTLRKRIQQRVFQIKALGLVEESNVGVRFIDEICPASLKPTGNPAPVMIGLFHKPERTPDVQTELAKAVGEVITELVPRFKPWCKVHITDRSEPGYWQPE